MHKKKSFILRLVIVFLKAQMFTFFPKIRMDANSAEICTVGNSKADFQQATLDHIVMKHQLFKFSKEK